MLIRLSGGLGNQLFQYAVGELIRLTMGENVTYETFSYLRDKKRTLQLDKFQIVGIGKTMSWHSFIYYVFARMARESRNVTTWDRRFGILRDDLSTTISRECLEGKKYLVGYWQNVDNLNAIKENLQKQFQCKESFPKLERIREQIAYADTVALHVRRGDYLQSDNSGMYAACSPEYYNVAMSYMKERLENPIFLVFSNDLTWCKNNLNGDNIYFMDEQYSISDINDFCLMKECKHFIIANSTFSWWASWLADNPDKIVIAPKNWFVDEEKNSKVQEALLGDVILM